MAGPHRYQHIAYLAAMQVPVLRKPPPPPAGARRNVPPAAKDAMPLSEVLSTSGPVGSFLSAANCHERLRCCETSRSRQLPPLGKSSGSEPSAAYEALRFVLFALQDAGLRANASSLLGGADHGDFPRNYVVGILLDTWVRYLGTALLEYTLLTEPSSTRPPSTEAPGQQKESRRGETSPVRISRCSEPPRRQTRRSESALSRLKS